ncbi:hypothetical protein MRX96_032198 [Rhipicephalus microplus]
MEIFPNFLAAMALAEPILLGLRLVPHFGSGELRLCSGPDAGLLFGGAFWPRWSVRACSHPVRTNKARASAESHSDAWLGAPRRRRARSVSGVASRPLFHARAPQLMSRNKRRRPGETLPFFAAKEAVLRWRPYSRAHYSETTAL